MISIYKQDGDITYGVKEFIIDTPSDLVDLPTNKTKVRPGSTAFVISTSEKYMLNNQEQWILLKGSGGGSGDNAGNLTPFPDNAGTLTVF